MPHANAKNSLRPLKILQRNGQISRQAKGYPNGIAFPLYTPHWLVL